MCPQACDDEILSSERTNEIREVGAEDGDGWRSAQHVGLNQGRTRRRTWKRQFDATEASEHSRPPVSDHRSGRLVLRRPIARYRRSVGTEGAGASAAVDLSAAGSYEAPINLSSPEVGMGIGSQASGSQIINLDADTDVGRDSQDFKSSEVPYSLRDQSVSLPSIRCHENNRGSINAEPSRGRTNGLGEPLPKRICNMAEGAVDSRSDEIPTHAGGRPSRNYGFFRASGRSWGRERTRPLLHSSFGDIRPINIDDVGSPQTEQRERSMQLDEDERLARQLQEAFASDASVSGNDAGLARVLQEEENRRLLRVPPPPPPMAVDPVRMHMLYLRHIERARAALYGRNHHASSSRQGEMPRQRSRIFNGDGSRRFRFSSSAAMEERLNVIGALLQGQVPLAMQLAYVDRDFNENDYEMLLALDDNVRQRGASQSRIDELPVTEFEATDSTEPCSICLEVPEAGDQVRRLPCTHGFHQECIDTWLQRRANCPVCKGAI